MKFLNFLDSEMVKPLPYGWFHLMCFAIVIALSVLVIVFRKKFNTKSINIILLVTGIVMIVFEIYKQVIMNFDNGAFEPYHWYIFPFQFCSTPMYLMVTAGLIGLISKKNGNVYSCIVSYLATFALFAGVAVMFLPTTVFIETIGINIQTMVVHGGMVVIGVLLLATQTTKVEWKTLLKAVIVFTIMVVAALVMNIVWRFVGPYQEHTFNMFFISPWYNCELPLLQIVQDATPYVVFLLTYIIGFTACASIVLAAAIGIKKLHQIITNKKKSS